MILALINSRFLPLIGGGETYTLELMAHFRAAGWDVHLITSERGFGHDTWQGCTIHYIDGFDDNDLHIHTAAPQLRTALDAINPDLIHVHNIMPYFVLSSVVAPREFPTLLTIHNTPCLPDRVFGSFNDFKSESVFTQQLLANGKFDHLVVGSQYYLDAYATVAPSIRARSSVAWYFPPSTTSRADDDMAAKNPAKKTLLFPSRILRRKGIEDCLHALKKLPSEYELSLPSFCHAEDRAYRDHVVQLISDLGLQDRVQLPAQATTPERMCAYYDAADIVLVPSHYEGFGIVAVEAMARGLPVIATAVGGLGEILEDRRNGIVVPPHDSEAIASAVALLEQDAALKQRISQGGMRTATEKFSRSTHMDKIAVLYKAITEAVVEGTPQ